MSENQATQTLDAEKWHQLSQNALAARAILFSCERALYEYRSKTFPTYSFARYGCATVAIVGDSQCPPDKMPCLFENGNVWWKDPGQLERIPAKDAPRRVRLVLLRNQGIKCEGSV